MILITVKELPEGLKPEADQVDEAVLRAMYKFLVMGGMTEVAAIEYTKQLVQQGILKEFPPKN